MTLSLSLSFSFPLQVDVTFYDKIAVGICGLLRRMNDEAIPDVLPRRQPNRKYIAAEIHKSFDKFFTFMEVTVLYCPLPTRIKNKTKLLNSKGGIVKISPCAATSTVATSVS